MLLISLLRIGTAIAQAPVITSFSPASGPVGTTVTINGSNLNTSGDAVYFGAAKAQVTAASSAQLKVIVPAGANYQFITVTTNLLTAYSSIPFNITFNATGALSSQSFTGNNITAGSYVYGTAAKDINGDGLPDLIVVNSGANNVEVFKNTSSQGNLSYAQGLTYPTGSYPIGVAVDDLDGDGLPDLVVTNFTSNTVSVYLNTSTVNNVSFLLKGSFPTGTSPYGVSIADFDGDGRPDIVVANEYANPGSVSVFKNLTSSAGNISFAAKQDLLVGTWPRSLTTGDINGDGKPDIIVANQASATISILKNTSANSNISFAPKYDLATPSGSSPESIALGDLNGDGKLDIVVANNNSPGSVSVFNNNSASGSVAFLPRQDFTTGNNPFSVATGDINGDGKPDIVVSNQVDNTVSVLTNISAGNTIALNPKIDFATGNYPRSVNIADENGDGKPDIIVGNSGSNIVSVLVNNLSTNTPSPPSTIPAPNISYQTPKTYQINKVIASLAPTNTGSPVPAAIYGQVSTFAGVGYDNFSNGPALNAAFWGCVPVGLDMAGNMFIGDWGNNLIREINTAGIVSTFAGNPNAGSANGTGTAASFFEPDGLVVDAAGTGNIYVADQLYGLIRAITPSAVVTTLAGGGFNASYADGTGSAAIFNNPRGLAIDGSGNLYVADQGNNLIRKVVTSTGVVTTVAGTLAPGFVNGTGTGASFNTPTSVGIDAAGNLYVGDAGNNAIRKITPAGVVTTFAGNGNAGAADGTGSAATFNYPREVRADAAGNLYVVDSQNNKIRKISAGGVVTTLAGSGQAGATNGIGTASSFNAPIGLVLDGIGNLYVGDYGNSLVRKVSISGYSIDKTLPAGLTFDPTTGIITGTPTVLSPPIDYTITAYNAGGSSTTVVNIQVVEDSFLPSIITFPPPNMTVDGNNDITPGATSTNTETPIVYTSSNPAVAIITADGLIHLIAPGVTVITATQAGNADYSPAAPVTETLTVTETQVIYFPAFSAESTCSADFPAGAITSNSTLPLSYSSSNTAVATISATGTIHIVGVGTTTITVSQAGNNLFTPATPQSEVLTITAPLTPAITITANNNSVCAGMPITFTAAVSNGSNVSYQWQVNGVNVAGNNAAISLTSIAATDVIQCIVTNGGICPVSATSNSLTGVVGMPYVSPFISIQSSAGVSVCTGTLITFSATGTNGGNSPVYQWQVNGVNAGTNNPVFASSSLNNGDIVTCIFTNTTSQCLTVSTVISNSIEVSITALSNLIPEVTISPDYYSSCDGFSVTYKATATNAGNNPAYQWQVNGQNAGVNVAEFTSAALNTGDKVTCIVTTSIACSVATATSNVATLKSDPEIVNTVSITTSANNNIIAPNDLVTFTAKTAYTTTSVTTVAYQWQVNGVNAGSNSPIFTTNTLVNGDVVNCTVTTSGACIAIPVVYSNSIKIIVITPVIIKNTFTPNGDGINDTWNIPALDAYPTSSVSIYTRYGTLVYNSIGYPKPWDGTYNNTALPTGTYYYVIDLKNGNKPLSGYVTLLR